MTISLENHISSTNDLKHFYEKGFFFSRIDVEDELLEKIKNIKMYDLQNFNKIYQENYNEHDIKVHRRFILSPENEINQIVFDKIKEKVDLYFKGFMNKYLLSELHCFSVGEEVAWHNDFIQKALFLAIAWFPEDSEEYLGREICFKNEKTGVYYEHQPRIGDFCIFDNMNPDLFHKVKTLLSNKKVITFTYDLGSYK